MASEGAIRDSGKIRCERCGALAAYGPAWSIPLGWSFVTFFLWDAACVHLKRRLCPGCSKGYLQFLKEGKDHGE